MSIPDYQSLMLPLLKTAADGKEHTKREVLNELAVDFLGQPGCVLILNRVAY